MLILTQEAIASEALSTAALRSVLATIPDQTGSVPAGDAAAQMLRTQVDEITILALGKIHLVDLLQRVADA